MQKLVIDDCEMSGTKSEEYSSFEMAFQDHEQYHAGRSAARGLHIVHVVFGSRLRPCKPHASDLTIANTWVRFSSQVRGDTHNSQII